MKSVKNEKDAEDGLEGEESSMSNHVRDKIASADDGDVREFMAHGAIRIRLWSTVVATNISSISIPLYKTLMPSSLAACIS